MASASYVTITHSQLRAQLFGRPSPPSLKLATACTPYVKSGFTLHPSTSPSNTARRARRSLPDRTPSLCRYTSFEQEIASRLTEFRQFGAKAGK